MNQLIVSKDGPIKSIQEAINSIVYGNHVSIYIKEGIYEEKIIIDKPNIDLIGEGINKTIIKYNDYSKKIHPDGRDYNTFRTPTALVLGDYCKIKDLAIYNSADPKGGQAIALAIYGNHFSLDSARISSYNDTLFLGPLPDDLKERYTKFLTPRELFIEGNLYSHFKNALIEGSIDFIFGAGSALFDRCNIVSLKEGYVAAPGHSLFQKDGFIFNECHFINQTNLMNSTYLARPWRPYGKCVFLKCSYDNHIKKEGIALWHNLTPEEFSRFYEYPYNPSRVKYFLPLNDYEYEKYITRFMNF